MKDEEILKKVIEKAFKDAGITDEDAIGQIRQHGGYRTIFSHRFAKAFWGEFKMRYYNRDFKDITKEEYDRIDDDELVGSELISKGWKSHLRAMVLEEEPLQYIRRFL